MATLDRPDDLPDQVFSAFLALVDTVSDADALQRGLGALIASHPDHADVLEALASSHRRERSEPPEWIGPYRVLDRIGTGGMGEVYRAQRRAPVRQDVAIKVVKRGLATREVLARFELERRALAAMSHRSIARVLDAGETDRGEPYFVMELVEGLPLNRWCDKHRASLAERLALFQEVCHGVHHAHQKGVVHRDLKPGNVLVTREGEQPVVKILDFGLAKATNRDFLDVTLFTQHDRILGTLEYMAPEQAAGDGEVIDARADVYSLGVMLYELLTGELPLSSAELRTAGPLEALRLVREKDPPTPSVRIGALGRAGAEAASQRRTTLQLLRRELRGDLDWVVGRTLAKEPERRYDSASALAADIQRYLDLQPVLAGPPGVGYRLRKFVRRNRVHVIAAALLLVVGVTLGGVAFRQYREARVRATEAEAARFDAVRQAEHARASAGRATVAEQRERERAADAEREAEAARRATVEAQRQGYIARLAAAGAAIEALDAPGARTQLAACAPGERGIEWQLMRYLTDASVVRIDASATRPTSVSIAPDGAWVAFGGNGDPQLRCIELGTGAERWRASPHEFGADCMASSSDGHLVASGDSLGVVHVLDTSDGRVLRRLQLRSDDYFDCIDSLAFHPTRSWLAAGAGFRRVVVVDVESGETVRELELPAVEDPVAAVGRAITALAFSPGGDQLVAKLANDSLVRWDTDSWRAASSTDQPWRFSSGRSEIGVFPQQIGFLTDELIAFGTNEGGVAVYDVTDLQLYRYYRLHESRVLSVVTDSSTGLIAAGSEDRTLTVVNAFQNLPGARLLGHDDEVRSMAMTSDGVEVASVARDGTVRIWGIARERPRWRPTCGLPRAASADLEHRVALVGENDGTLEVIDLTRGVVVTRLPQASSIYNGRFRQVALASRASRAVIVELGERPYVLDTASGAMVASLNGHDMHAVDESGARRDRLVLAAAISADGRVVASCGEDRTARMWDCGDGDAGLPPQPVGFVRAEGPLRALTLAADGAWLLAGGDDGCVYELRRGGSDVAVRIASTRPLGEPDAVTALAICFDQTRWALGRASGQVEVWRRGAASPELTLQAHGGKVLALAFTPDGDTLFSGGADRAVCATRLSWSAVTARWRVSGAVEHLHVDAAGTSLLVLADGVVELWDTVARRPRVQAIRHARLVQQRATDAVNRCVAQSLGRADLQARIGTMDVSPDVAAEVARQVALLDTDDPLLWFPRAFEVLGDPTASRDSLATVARYLDDAIPRVDGHVTWGSGPPVRRVMREMRALLDLRLGAAPRCVIKLFGTLCTEGLTELGWATGAQALRSLGRPDLAARVDGIRRAAASPSFSIPAPILELLDSPPTATPTGAAGDERR
ncbi:MAG: protein kinase [Planctomycetes bacterium]|nr:protein kinase [Planctomycetota bacterium]